MSKRLGLVVLILMAVAVVGASCKTGNTDRAGRKGGDLTGARVGQRVTLETPSGTKTYLVAERFSGKVETRVDLPGKDVPEGVLFSGTQNITAIDFEAGAAEYRGQKVDFDGKEKQFIGSNYKGSMILNVGGNHRAEARATVDGAGDSAVSGPVEAKGTLTYTNVTVDKGLSKDSVALAVGSTAVLTSYTDSWQSSVVSQLNGAAVATQCRVSPTAVDAATGVIQRDFSGSILVAEGDR